MTTQGAADAIADADAGPDAQFLIKSQPGSNCPQPLPASQQPQAPLPAVDPAANPSNLGLSHAVDAGLATADEAGQEVARVAEIGQAARQAADAAAGPSAEGPSTHSAAFR